MNAVSQKSLKPSINTASHRYTINSISSPERFLNVMSEGIDIGFAAELLSEKAAKILVEKINYKKCDNICEMQKCDIALFELAKIREQIYLGNKEVISKVVKGL